MSYQYEITKSYCWYDEGSKLVKMYFIQGIPFSFDLIETDNYCSAYLEEADICRRYNMDDVLNSSSYLIQEEMHPLLFDVELKNPEDLPDIEIEYGE